METVLYVIVIALVVNLMANMIWKYLPGTDKRADVWATVTMILVCVLIVIYRKDDPKVNAVQQVPPAPAHKYELVPHDTVSWQQLISEAKFRVYANGIIANSIDPQTLVEKVKNNDQFEAKVVLLKPDGTFVGARADDEKMTRNPGRIMDKLLTFRDKSSSLLNQKSKARLSIKYIDVYPTISVFVIDNTLYAYFYPYGAGGTSSPVMIFRDFEDGGSEESKLAGFFLRHFQSIEEEAKAPTEADYTKYEGNGNGEKRVKK